MNDKRHYGGVLLHFVTDLDGNGNALYGSDIYSMLSDSVAYLGDNTVSTYPWDDSGTYPHMPDTWIVEVSLVKEIEQFLWKLDEQCRDFTRQNRLPGEVVGLGWELRPVEPEKHVLFCYRHAEAMGDGSRKVVTSLVREKADGPNFLMSECHDYERHYPAARSFYGDDVDDEGRPYELSVQGMSQFMRDVEYRHENFADECKALGFPAPELRPFEGDVLPFEVKQSARWRNG